MSKTPKPMPEGKTDAQLAEEFASFFLNKIEKKNHTSIPTHWSIHPGSQHFSPKASGSSTTDQQRNRGEILSMKNKTCELGAIPTNLIKDILPAVLKTITQIVKCCLQLGPSPRLEDSHHWTTDKKVWTRTKQEKWQACFKSLFSVQAGEVLYTKTILQTLWQQLLVTRFPISISCNL